MSRISAAECALRDMEGYGVDRKGNIAVFCSGGVGNLQVHNKIATCTGSRENGCPFSILTNS